MSHRDPGPIPSRWLNCPRNATGLLAEKFLAFKTPLGSQFNDKVPEKNRFTPSMIFHYVKSFKMKLGLWIDLTNTSRFYNKKEIEDKGCKYVKLQCRGHGETPSVEQTKLFINLVSTFMRNNPLEMIGVHCTHGFNRTGFLLASYMVEQLDFSVEAALSEFAKLRHPGIYKEDYLEELCKRYDAENTPFAPERPDWCNEGEELDYDDDDDQTTQSAPQGSSGNNPKSKGRGRRETTHKKEIFMPGVQGVDPFDSQPKLAEVQRMTQQFCGWKSVGFPGSQPVSMCMANLKKLHVKPYRVSWKADGVRYMMLIKGEDEVYMLDRDNCVFKVNGLRFVCRNDLSRHLINTLLDGEMVIDKVEGKDIARYLCYDIIRFNGQDVRKMAFYPVRLSYIENDIVNPRHEAMKKGLIIKNHEPFSIRLKQFWELPMAHQLLGEKFAKQLSHEPDGLIFQPSKEPYVAGRCDDVLKWKPGHMNSVDFKLKIVRKDGMGMLPTREGLLYVGQMEEPFSSIKVTKEVKDLDNKIIECAFDKDHWVFMRERTDKSFPNSYTTAMAVCDSIQNPVTTEILLDMIDNHRFHDDSDIMPPPKRMRR